MIIGGNAQANSKDQFPSQKKILSQERHLHRIANNVAKYFVPAVIFIVISAGVGWYLVGVTGATFSVTGAYSLLSFFSVIILAVVLVLLVLVLLLH
jgi:cation transport ATPase